MALIFYLIIPAELKELNLIRPPGFSFRMHISPLFGILEKKPGSDFSAAFFTYALLSDRQDKSNYSILSGFCVEDEMAQIFCP